VGAEVTSVGDVVGSVLGEVVGSAVVGGLDGSAVAESSQLK